MLLRQLDCVVYNSCNGIKRNVDIGSDIEDPAAEPSSTTVTCAVGSKCASRGGADLCDQAHKVIGDTKDDTGKSKTGLSAALCIDSHSLADMTTEVGIEAVIHRYAETPFMKVGYICICSIAI